MEKQYQSYLSGIAGEYYVAAELSDRGYIASLNLKNTEGIDILASNQDGSKQVAIQVKTSKKPRKEWLLTKKAENLHSPNLFYIFVDIYGADRKPSFHIVTSKIVADYVKKDHKEWLNTVGKEGRKHRDNPIRKFRDLDKGDVPHF